MRLRKKASGTALPCVAPVIFGFMPSAQLDLVAGNLRTLSDQDRQTIYKLAADVASATGAMSTQTGIACRLEKGEAILVGSSVEEVERSSGRSGLSVIVGVVILGRSFPKGSMYSQILTAVDLAIASVSPERHQGAIAAATALTRRLQHGTDASVRESLEAILSGISTLFSQLLVVSSDSTYNDTGNEVAFALCRLLIETLHSSRRSQIGYYLDFMKKLPADLSTTTDNIRSCHFIDNGVIILKDFCEAK